MKLKIYNNNLFYSHHSRPDDWKKDTSLVTLGQWLKFTTIEKLPNQQAPILLKGVQSVISIYNKKE